jgi:ketosteroid isomerase-like protein
MRIRDLMLGAAAAIVARSLFIRLLVLKFGRDVEKLNAGDHSSLLAAYSDDFVLHFNEGDHRWSGDWVGKDGMDRFLRNFTRARIQGEIRSVAISGPLWALTLWVRFDDHVDAPDGRRIYENQTVLVLRTRLGKVVEQHDFYVDTGRILELDRQLSELGVGLVGKTP